ncbi:4674_t:CDS:2, partial [Rhizophagus irregularis]
FNEIIENFNHLKSKPLGKDIIQVNNVHGKNILSVILNYAKRLNVNNEKLKNGLIMINNNYLFRVYSDPVKNSNDKSAKKARLDFNALGTDTESAASKHYKSQFEALQSELNNLKADNRVSTNRGRIAKPERKANKYLNRVKHDEDELLHYPLEEYNSEYEDYSFGGEFNPDQKSDMHNKIVTVMNVKHSAQRQINYFQLSVLFKFVKDNNFEIVSNEDKENYSSAITDFCENITDEQKKIYDDMAEILNIQAVNDFWQDVEKLNRRNKINNSKEKYLDHLEESTYEVLDDTRSYVVADVKAETGKRKSARSEIPTRYDRNKSSEGQNIVIESGHDEQKQTKRVRFHEEKPPSKKKSKSGKRGNTLPDGVKITKLPPINYAEGDETDDGIPSNEANDYSDDDKEALPPEDSLYFVLSSSKVWTLPSGKNVGDIYTEKISENAHTVKNKKRLTAIKKAILRYGSLRIIDLSTHMKKWFCENDKKFIKKDYESMLRVLKMTGKESSFVLKVEDI